MKVVGCARREEKLQSLSQALAGEKGKVRDDDHLWYLNFITWVVASFSREDVIWVRRQTSGPCSTGSHPTLSWARWTSVSTMLDSHLQRTSVKDPWSRGGRCWMWMFLLCVSAPSSQWTWWPRTMWLMVRSSWSAPCPVTEFLPTHQQDSTLPPSLQWLDCWRAGDKSWEMLEETSESVASHPVGKFREPTKNKKGTLVMGPSPICSYLFHKVFFWRIFLT